MKTILKQESPEKQRFEEWKALANLEEKYQKVNEKQLKIDDLWDMISAKMPISDKDDAFIFPKEELQKALLKEQGYICCYCGVQISEDNMRIEHFYPKSQNAFCTFNYDNLHAACEGGGQGTVYIKTDLAAILTEKNMTIEDIKRLNKGKTNFNKGDKVQITEDPFHCDNLKGDNANNPNYKKTKDKNGDMTPIAFPFIVSPLLPNIDKKFKYLNDGTVQAINEEETIIKDSIILLGLNVEKLKNARKKAIKNANDIFLRVFFDDFNEDIATMTSWLKSEMTALYTKEILDEYCFVTVSVYRNSLPLYL